MAAFETPEKVAQRDCFEETGFIPEVDQLHEMFFGREHKHDSDILLVFDAQITSGELCAGDDVDCAEFFLLDSLQPLAFHSTDNILQ